MSRNCSVPRWSESTIIKYLMHSLISQFIHEGFSTAVPELIKIDAKRSNPKCCPYLSVFE